MTAFPYDPPTPEFDALHRQGESVSAAEYIARLEQLARELEMRLSYAEARRKRLEQQLATTIQQRS